MRTSVVVSEGAKTNLCVSERENGSETRLLTSHMSSRSILLQALMKVYKTRRWSMISSKLVVDQNDHKVRETQIIKQTRETRPHT